MRTAIIISAIPQDLAQLREIYKKIGSTNIDEDGRLVVTGEWGWFIIEKSGAIEKELEYAYEEFEDDREKIAMFIAEPKYASLEYTTPAAANLAIMHMPSTSVILIDNDCGVIIPLKQLKEMIVAGTEWHSSSTQPPLNTNGFV